MRVSLGGRWSRIATTLSLPALTIVLSVTSGCRSDGASRPSLSALSPARWFARQDDNADDGFDLKPIPGGGYDTPPVPPSAPIGRAFIPAPAPAPDADAFYGVRPTSDETPEATKPTFGEKLRGLFRKEQTSASESNDIQPISYQSFGQASPATIAAHIEPVQADRRPAKLPTIVARRFPMPLASEPAPWPYGPAARTFATDEPRQIEPARFARERPMFLPLPGGDVASNGPALLR